MSSLFDESSDSDNSSFGMNGDTDTDDDDTTFTVANVLQKRRGPSESDRSRRDTITRTMPTISIHESHDKYAIPNTVEKKKMHQHNEKERTQLRITESLVDHSSSDSENENHDEFRRDSDISGMTSKGSFSESIFRTPSRGGHTDDNLASKLTVVRRNTASLDASKNVNLLDEEVVNESDINASPKDAEQSNRSDRRHSSERFMSVYEELAAKKVAQTSAQTKDHGGGGATVKAVHVKTLVTKALKVVADGLVSHATSNTCDGIGTWDVDDTQNLSGKKRSLDIDDIGDSNDSRQRNRRKSLNIRAEMALLQDMVQDKTEECARLKRKLEESQSQVHPLGGSELLSLQSQNAELVLIANKREEAIQSLKTEREQARTKMSILEGAIGELKEKTESLAAELDASKSEISIVIRSKVILESKLALSRDAASAADAKVKSLSCRLKDSQSEADKLRLLLQVERDKLEEAASELKATKREKELAEKEKESTSLRAELQDKMDEMRKALQQIRDVERDRKEKTKLIEAELLEARDALSTANLKVAESETAVISLRCAMDELKRENQSLRDLVQLKRETPARWKMEWIEGTEGIEIEMNGATPQTTQLDNINSLGAEDTAGSELSDHVSKLPLMAILQRTPDSSSRQLSFASSESMLTPGKENNPKLQSDCSLCCRPHRPNAALKRCQCGREDCMQWVHATCLLNRKSVSSCVSHPGTPAPPLPMILCKGIWHNKLPQDAVK